MKKTVLFTLFSMALLWGCQEDLPQEKAEIINSEISKTKTESHFLIPYADTKTLESFSKDRELIDYSFARRLAIIELQNSNFTEDMKWEGYTISERPVIIYGFDSKPKSYEFFMKDAEGIEKGSIKVAARRNAPDILEELKNTVTDYGSFYSKASSDMKIIENWEGDLYAAVVGKSGENVSSAINLETGELANEELRELSEPEIFNKIADNIETKLRQEFFLNYDAFENSDAAEEIKESELKGGLQEQMNALKKEIEEEQIAREKYWSIVEECRDSIMTLSDAEIKEIYSKNWWSRQWKSLVGVKTYPKYELPKFKDKLLYREKLHSWCGPWALGWIYYSETKKDSYSKFESYYDKILAKIFGGKPFTPADMWIATLVETKGQMFVRPFFSKTREDAYEYIRGKKQPIIILRGVSHYCVAYGCYKKQHGFWWTNYYFAVKDNGHEIDEVSRVTYRRASWIIRFIKTNIRSNDNYYRPRPGLTPIRKTQELPYDRPIPNFRRIPLGKIADNTPPLF